MKFYLVTYGKMHKNIDVHYYLKDTDPQVEASIKMYVQDNVDTKMDAYFKKILSHEDVRITIDVKIARHEDGRYDGTFIFILDGKEYTPYKREMFENVHDLVNHAFDHLKEQIADEKDRAKNIPKDKTENVKPMG